jgi:hypothetical protein
MTFKPKLWYPIALLLTLVNVAGVWVAAAATEPPHATLHGVLGVVCALWAGRLRRRLKEGEAEALPPGNETLALDVDDLREQLAETQERLDFAERVLAQQQPVRRDQ